MKIRCKCGQKLKLHQSSSAKQFKCPKCGADICFGLPERVGNFKLVKQVYNEEEFYIFLARQGALQLNLKVVVFAQDRYQEVVLASKKLASAPFFSSVKLLDMGSEGIYGYIALEADIENQSLADWFLRGIAQGVKKPFIQVYALRILGLIFSAVLLVIIMFFSLQDSKAIKMYNNSDWKIRRASLRLAESTNDGDALLIQALNDKKYLVRIAACQELSKRKGKNIKQALKNALHDKSKLVRQAAKKALLVK